MSSAALVTGASAGIGYELARVIAADGQDVILAARSEDKLRELAALIEKESGVKTYVIPVDLSRTDGASELIRQVAELELTVETLVNNAGFGELGPYVSFPWESFRSMIQVNVMSLAELTHAYLPGMIERRQGRLLNVASTAAFQPGPLMAVYFASKAFVLSFTEAIAEETKQYGLAVTTLCPGPTMSDFIYRAQMLDSGLVKGKKLPTSREVAEFGYAALKRKQVVAVHGWNNWIFSNLPRIAPRSVVRPIVKAMNVRR